MIILTDGAITQLKKILKDQTDRYVRVGIVGGGCSGFEYKLDLVDKSEYSNKIYNKYDKKEVTVVVDKKAELYIDGTTLDWYEDTIKQGFTFDNPNANKTCGCGSSFSV
jgi:iron-sulfur cluster assembly protein